MIKSLLKFEWYDDRDNSFPKNVSSMSNEYVEIPPECDTTAQAAYIIRHAKRIQHVELRHAANRCANLANSASVGFYICRPVIRIQTVIGNNQYSGNYFTFDLEQADDQSPWKYIFPGALKYNQLLAVIEDVVNMPIEDFTFGLFHYLEEEKVC